MASETTEFSSHVPTAEYKFFKENFPQYGAVKWFITSALIEFNEQVRQNPSLKEQINGAIEQMLETSRLMSQAAGAANSGGEPGKSANA